jgi:hypothetical protein
MHRSPSRRAVLHFSDDIEAIRVQFITRDNQGQIEVGSDCFLVLRCIDASDEGSVDC